MKNFKILNNLSEISNKFDAYIIDIWGVLWDGIEPYEYAKDALEKLKKKKKKIILLSNAPRRSKLVAQRLNEIGINNNLYSTIISSGEVCRENFLKDKEKISKIGKYFYFIGQDADKGITSNLEIREKNNISNANFLLVCGTRDFDHKLKNYIAELNEGLKYKLPLICANPDKVVIRKNGKMITCAGILAEYYKNNGGKVISYGKPYHEVYKKSIQFFTKINLNISNKNILVIGDSLETDILGANKFGLKSLLVTNGIHSDKLFNNDNKNLLSKKLQVLSKTFAAYPDYTIRNLIF